MKTLSVTTPIKWKIQKTIDVDNQPVFWFSCTRLDLKFEAGSLEEGINTAKKVMEEKIKQVYNSDQIYKYIMDHGLAMTIRDITHEVDLIPPVAVIEDKPTGV